MMKKFFSLLVLLVLSLSLISCNTNNENEQYDKEFLSELDRMLLQFDDVSNIYGYTVSQNGERIKDNFYRRDENDFTHNVFSVTKSVTSLLVGIAIEEGYINSVDDYISEYIDITEYENETDLETIQIKHLLTMSAGLIWDSSDLASGMITLRSTLNPYTYVFERDMTFTPGTRFNYSDGTAHIMSIVFKAATNKHLNEFAQEHLFEPLGIEEPYWNDDTDGNNIGGCDLHLSFESMEKIGYLVLNKGVHNGEQLISETWLQESTNSTNAPVNYYGYYWWLSTTSGYTTISAKGWGGQFIYIIPELELIITTGASGSVSSESSGNQFDQIENIIIDDIIPHFIDEK